MMPERAFDLLLFQLVEGHRRVSPVAQAVPCAEFPG
jgi:hypothetical protein